METHLKGKTVFVTEALRHFGTPMAQAFAREGANLFLATLSDHEPLEEPPAPWDPWASRS